MRAGIVFLTGFSPWLTWFPPIVCPPDEVDGVVGEGMDVGTGVGGSGTERFLNMPGIFSGSQLMYTYCMYLSPLFFCNSLFGYVVVLLKFFLVL
jgi:hypothetical protein